MRAEQQTQNRPKGERRNRFQGTTGKLAILALGVAGLCLGGNAQASGQPSPTNQAARSGAATTSVSGHKVTPKQVKRQIKGAMIRLRKNFMAEAARDTQVDKAVISQKGKYAAIVDVRPTRDQAAAAIYDHAGKGWVKLNIFIDNGPKNPDNYLERISLIPKISYQPANNRIGDSVLTSIGKNPKWVGDTLSNFATNNRSKTMFEKAGNQSIKSVTLNKTGKPTKLERYK